MVSENIRTPAGIDRGLILFYEPLAAEGYEWINCCDGSDYEIFASFDGSPRTALWRPVRVRRVRVDNGSTFKASDFPWLGAHALVFARRSVDILGPLLTSHGELLPLAANDGSELFVLNVTRILDAIDDEHSDVVRFSDGRIMFIKSLPSRSRRDRSTA